MERAGAKLGAWPLRGDRSQKTLAHRSFFSPVARYHGYMDKERIGKIRTVARKVALSYSMPHYAELFAAEAPALAFLRPTATMRQLFLDYIRREIPGFRARQPMRTEPLEGEVAVEPPNLDPLLLSYLGGVYRALYHLLESGYQVTEMASLFGVSETAIHARLRELRKYLQAIVRGDEMTLREQPEPSFQCDNCMRKIRHSRKGKR
jgi:hypothetical protein